MGEFDVLRGESPARGRSLRDLVWVALAALLVGLFTMGSPWAASASDEASSPPCAPGQVGQIVRLPSGRAQAFCYQARAGAAADAPTTSAANSISLAKTVGTDENACATGDSISVDAGTTVIYCYTVTNTGGATLTTHDLVDDKLGDLLTDFPYELGPGASAFVTSSAVISVDTTNVATWTATDGVDPASSVDTASVLINPSATVPGAPAWTGALPVEGGASLTWSPPSSDGGSDITGYRITPVIGGVDQTPVVVDAAPQQTVLDGLTNGTTYRFRIAAINAIGTGDDSELSAEVTPQWWLPWSSGPVAVDELFTWFTGASPATSVADDWLGQLDAGDKLPGDLVLDLRRGTDATKNVDPVVRLYSAYFLRTPDRSGLAYWLGKRRAGSTLSRISSTFAGSSEFKARYGTLTNRQFVEQIYLNVLGRPGETSGVDYWTKQLDTKRKSRGQVMLNFSESNEYRTKQANNVDAAVVYLELVGRRPTTGERDAFAAALKGGTPLPTLVRDQIHVPSFADRAG
jgi:hypothetical protein